MTDICHASGKVRYATKAAAIAAREVARRIFRYRVPTRGREFPQHVYQCQFCHTWHLTKVDQAKANKRRR